MLTKTELRELSASLEPVRSSWIASIGFKESPVRLPYRRGLLILKLHTNEIHVYAAPQSLYKRLVRAKSPGKAWHRYIKGRQAQRVA